MQKIAKLQARKRLIDRRRINTMERNDLINQLLLKEIALEDAQAKLKKAEAQLADLNAEVEALRRISEATVSAFGSEDLLTSIAAIAERITNTEDCHIYLLNEDKTKLVLRAASSDSKEFIGVVSLDIGAGITGWVAKERQWVAKSRKAYEDHRFFLYPEMHESDYESFLSVPLVVHNEVIGVINVRTRQPHEYNINQVRLLANIASQVAGALDHMRRFRRLEAQAEQLNAVTEVSKTITSDMYLEEILQFIVNLTANTMNYKICTVRLLDDDGKFLILKATQAQSRAYLSKPSLRIGQSIAGKAAMENAVITVPDVRKNSEYRNTGIAHEEGLVSLACVPIRSRNRVLGVMNCYTNKPHNFTNEELATLETIASQAGLAIEHAKLSVRSAILQEMHHRVKNNLQQIASLLRLQLQYSKYDTLEDAINESLGRIMAIAAVHELLSRDDLDRVSVKKVAESILHHTQQALIPPGKNILTQVLGDNVSLPLNQATSMALALNELILNAVKHGLSEEEHGVLNVVVTDYEEKIVVAVENSGKPLPMNFNPDSNQRMGLRIVDTLVRDSLNGKFKLVNDERTTAVVEIPKQSIL